MKTNLTTEFRVDKVNNTLTMRRAFAAPVPLVWKAWTDPQILEKWWAPKPWKAHTKHMDFRVGGYWLYAMMGPEGEVHWGRADYEAITIERGFKATDAFCDEKGNINSDLPSSRWDIIFNADDDHTTVNMKIIFQSLEDLEKMIEMGAQEGFGAAIQQLEEWLAQQM